MNVHSDEKTTDTAKRLQILEAALGLFSDQGFHGTSMSKLAKASGLPVGTIYRHFAGKEELIHALYADLKRDRMAAMIEGYDATAPLRARFDQLWGNTFDYCLTHPAEFKFAEQYAYSPFLRDGANAIQASIPKEVAAFFADGYSSGTFKSQPPQILNALISGLLNALVTRALANVITLTPSTRSALMDACWDAITN
mgnify:FL=1